MNGHDDSITSSSTDTSPSKPLATPKGLPSLNGKASDSAAKAKADSRSSTPRQGTHAQSDTQKALEGAVRDLRVRCIFSISYSCVACFLLVLCALRSVEALVCLPGWQCATCALCFKER